jgi:uncharacterized protein YndB with AHSA1/START domain
MANEPTKTGPDKPAAAEELHLTRTVDAPRDVLFKVWIEADHFAQWFGPHGVEVPFCKIDARPGGVLHFCHRRSDGTEVWVKGAYREVVAPERLVFDLGFVDADGRAAPPPMFPDWPLGTTMLTTVTFEDLGGKTQLTVRQGFLPPEAAANDVVRRVREGAQLGWGETLDRLAEHVGTRA